MGCWVDDDARLYNQGERDKSNGSWDIPIGRSYSRDASMDLGLYVYTKVLTRKLEM